MISRRSRVFRIKPCNPCLILLQEHARIGTEIALEDSDLHVAALDGRRQEDQFILCLAQQRLIVIVLKRHRIGVLIVGRVGEPGLAVLREAEIRDFIGNNRPLLVVGIEAVGHPFVIGPHLQAEAVSKSDIQLLRSHL